MVIMMGVFTLVFLSLIQAASRTLQSILILALMMGLAITFISCMIIFTLQSFDATLLFQIMFMSQVGACILTFFMRVQNCISTR